MDKPILEPVTWLLLVRSRLIARLNAAFFESMNDERLTMKVRKTLSFIIQRSAFIVNFSTGVD
jgi:hypothetical protein